MKLNELFAGLPKRRRPKGVEAWGVVRVRPLVGGTRDRRLGQDALSMGLKGGNSPYLLVFPKGGSDPCPELGTK